MKHILLIFLLCPLYAFPAISCSNGSVNATGCGAATTCPKAFGSNTTAGDMLFATIQVNQAATLSISDTSLNTWVQDTNSPTNTTGPLKQATFYVVSAVGGADTVTGASTVSGNMFINLFECSGMATSSPEDVSAVGATGNNTTPATNATAATTCANEVVIASFGTNGGALATPAGFTSSGAVTGGWQWFGWQIVAATGSQSASTTSTTGNWIAQIDTFKASTCSATSGGGGFGGKGGIGGKGGFGG